MTTKEEIVAKIDAYRTEGIDAAIKPYTDTIADLTARLTAANATAQRIADELTAVKKAYDAHMALPAPAGHIVIPEPTHTVLLGGSYGGADESQYKGRAKVARIFVGGNLPSDVKTATGWKQAYDEGCRAFILSWKGTQSGATVANCLKTIPSDCTVYGCYFHEPEDNIANNTLTLAGWKSRHTEHAAAMRSVGVTPVGIFMAYTLNPKSGRNIMDYAVGDEGVLFDFYMNPAEGKDDPEGVVDKMAAACSNMSAKFTGTAETGVNMSTTSEAVAVDLAKRTRAALFAEPLASFGTWWSTNEFKFTAATADAWFDGV